MSTRFLFNYYNNATTTMTSTDIWGKVDVRFMICTTFSISLCIIALTLCSMKVDALSSHDDIGTTYIKKCNEDKDCKLMYEPKIKDVFNIACIENICRLEFNGKYIKADVGYGPEIVYKKQ